MPERETWPIDKILVNHRVRSTDDPEIMKLAASIVRIGLVNALVVDRMGQLIKGYRRLAALRILGRKEVDVLVVDRLEDFVGKDVDGGFEEEMTRRDLAMYAVTLMNLNGHYTRAQPGYGKKYNARDLVAKEIGIGSADAQIFFNVGRAVLSPNPDKQKAGQLALEEFDAGVSTRQVGIDLNARLRPDAVPVEVPIRVLASKQRRLLQTAAVTAAGVGMGLDQVGPNLHSDITKEEVDAWVADLSKARQSIERAIKFLRKERGEIVP